MEKAFYDYKKQKYDILDAVGQNDWQVYLVQSPDKKYFIIDTANAEFMNSAKPLRSVFNKFESDKMYDIAKFCQELQNEDLMVYEQQKFDVLSYDTLKKQGAETAERIAKAKQNGWQELNINNVEYAVDNDTLNILVDGKQFDVKERLPELSFNAMTDTEINDFINSWIICYNSSIGDLTQSQTNAECKVLAERKVAQFVKENKTSSYDLTEKIVENLDISDKYSGFQSDRAFAIATEIITYMSDNSIPYASEATLMGDCSALSYDLLEVIRQHQIYNTNCREEAIINALEVKALNELDKKGVLPLNVATNTEKNYTEIVNIPNSEDLDLTARKFLNPVIGAETYDIVIKSKYPYFDVQGRIIGSCNQQVLNTLLGTQNAVTKPNFNPVNNQAAETEKPAGTSTKPQKQIQM